MTRWFWIGAGPGFDVDSMVNAAGAGCLRVLLRGGILVLIGALLWWLA